MTPASDPARAVQIEQPLKAHKDGTISGLQAEVGAVVTSGSVICEITDRS